MEGQSALNSDLHGLKRDLQGKEMRRLVNALTANDEARIKSRVKFILDRLHRLPPDHQEHVLEEVRLLLASTDNEETKKSRLALLGSREAA